mmetsp:Transcript_3959/g.11688  ORF Transcript_3959/g.11688 Transcript_3959/m.11688 type:complete len:179 (-) Transcript_3959:1176-1712(-)
MKSHYANRNITEFLEIEFDSNVGAPPKYNSERRLLEYVDDNKYQQRNSPRQNIKMLIRRFSNPHAEDILMAPTFIDLMHAHDQESNTVFTDYFYDTLVDFETWAETSIREKIKEEFRTNTRHQLSLLQQDILLKKVLVIFRNSFAGPINPNRIIDSNRAGVLGGTVGPFALETTQRGP